LVAEVEKRVVELMHEVANQLECKVLALEVMSDHIHLFVNCPTTIAPDQIMFRIKGDSSRVLRQEFPHLLTMPSMWTRSYFVLTAANVSSQTIEKYIAQQKTR
jgi:putative transposase